MKYYIGIDTSNYTTSVAVTDETGKLISDERILLSVEQGKRGLRQSDALFLHLKNLPKLFERFPSNGEIAAVGVSNAPRRTEQSYMPVFLAGINCAKAIAATHHIPLYEFSHQEGHIRAALIGQPEPYPQEFYAVHLSGGTTEILSVRHEANRYHANILGSAQDISAGQLIDRIGVRLGLQFPCGKALELLSEKALAPVSFKLSVKGTDISFSGIEAQAMRAIEAGENAENIAKGTLLAISASLAKAFEVLFKKHGKKPLLLAGGVASNRLLRAELDIAFGTLLHFSAPHYATDNAVGIAYLAKEQKS